MNEYFADLHIHVGRTKTDKPVKITASNSLTIENILYEASVYKGMDIVGVIDCQVPEVLLELEGLIEKGEIFQLNEGGLQYKNVTLILGTEIEVYDEQCQGPLHTLVFLPTIELMKIFSHWLSKRMKNVSLSTQRIYESGRKLQEYVHELGGLFIPAHVFTPFKSLYGSGVKRSLEEVFAADLIDAIELGLSANTEMADQISELHRYTYLSNSDAHSLMKIAREYQVIKLKSPTFRELKKALKNEEGRKIVANYGLDPKLGKYHRTTCQKCLFPMGKRKVCAQCENETSIKGVYDRLLELRDTLDVKKNRPKYIHQVPLEFIPKLGPKTLEKLKAHFGTEMNILHHTTYQELKMVVNQSVAEKIIKARNGELQVSPGGGGRYGKVN